MFDNNVQPSTFERRLRKGKMSRYEALTTPSAKSHSMSNRLTELERESMFINRVTLEDYSNRIRKGWSHTLAVYLPIGVKRDCLEKGDYPISVSTLVEIYKNHSTLDTYRCRRALGWSHHEALTTPKRNVRVKKPSK